MTLHYDQIVTRHRLFASETRLVTSVPITKGSPYGFKSVFSTEVTDIKAASLVLVGGEHQVTTPYTYNVMIGSYMILASSPAATTGITVAQKQAQNFNREEHHFRDTRTGHWVTWTDVPLLYLNLVLYSAASGSTTGHKLTVDSGSLWAAVTSP